MMGAVARARVYKETKPVTSEWDGVGLRRSSVAFLVCCLVHCPCRIYCKVSVEICVVTELKEVPYLALAERKLMIIAIAESLKISMFGFQNYLVWLVCGYRLQRSSQLYDKHVICKIVKAFI